MKTRDTHSWAAGGTIAPTSPTRRAPEETDQVSLGYPVEEVSRQRQRRLPPTTPGSPEITRGFPTPPGRARVPTDGAGQPRVRQPHTWPQRLSGLLIAGLCVFCAVWYVPRVAHGDQRLLTGTVTTTGVVELNFANAGEINKVNVRLGDRVRRGEVLATEYAPNTATVVAAEKAAIAADRAKIAQLRAADVGDPAAAAADTSQLAADNAQLAVDEAQLAADRARADSSEIVAPSSGTVIAANGQAGEIVTTTGIHDYAADSQRRATTERPAFSLLPEGPQAVRPAPPSDSALPVIALRTSTSWQVIAPVPENRVSRIALGKAVTVSVPAAHISDVPGRIEEVLPTPIQTSQGTDYQAVVALTGHTNHLPLNGMAADIQLGS